MKTFCILTVGLILTLGLLETARSQQPLLSPRDSVEIAFGGRKISVNYGRPSMRGRKIMGGLVPFSKWWRTGANEATAFVTQVDLIVGSDTIPRGSYTLYTMPSEKQWKLIINKQTGQWGTIYNPDLDFARFPVKKKVLRNPVEKFTISLERNGSNSGVMKLIWEKTELSMGFRVKKDTKASLK